MSSKGLLVVFEGVNGAGKSTIINNIVAYYTDLEIPHSLYKFPNRSGPDGDTIDKYLKGEISFDSKYDVLDLFARDRKYVCSQIKQDLENGKIVICDRYIFSAIAYHVPSNILDRRVVRKYCSVIGYFNKDMPMPDLTFLVKGDFLRDRGIVNKEIFHYVEGKQRALHDMFRMVIGQYETLFLELRNRRGSQYFVAVDAIAEIHRRYLKKRRLSCPE